MRVIRSMKAGVVIAAVVLLASCGSNNDNNGQVIPPTTPTTPMPPAPPPTMVDQFVAFVRGLVDGPSAQSEVAEPVNITGVAVTTPDDSQPEAVKK